MTVDIDTMEAGPAMDALVEERVFGRTGLGYYGPPDSGKWSHKESKRFDTPEEAKEAYRRHYERQGCPCGHQHPDDFAPMLCYWTDDWGPLAAGEYFTDPADDYLVLQAAREWERAQRQGFARALRMIWEKRWHSVPLGSEPYILMYEPGDYSRAALKALEVKDRS